MCEGREDQTNERRETLFVWSHLSTGASEVKKPFLPNVQPMDFSAKTVRCANWRSRLREKSHFDVGLPTEDLAKGSPGEASID